MRVLVACEFSGVVRDAFAALGHDAWSCDILESEKPGQHLQCDIRDVLFKTTRVRPFDLLVAHPPCTFLAVSQARWKHVKGCDCDSCRKKSGHHRERLKMLAVLFVRDLLDAPVHRVCIENPISIISSRIRKPDQIIQPWQFGHGETKATCLWLKNLPPLKATNIVEGRAPRVHHASPGPDRWKERSRTLPGIAKAMAEQWG